MGYNSAALQQMRGQQLMDALNRAHKIFQQRNIYQYAVDNQYKRLADLRDDKDFWSLSDAIQHPAKWTVPVAVVLSVLVVLFYFRADDGDMLIPVLVTPFAFLGGAVTTAALMSFAGKSLKARKKKVKKIKDVVGAIGAIPIGVAILIMSFFGLGWLVVLYGLVGIYATLCLVDIKLIHRKQSSERTKRHFRKKDEQMALELSWRLKQLQDFCHSDAMQFAEALVPREFQGSQELGALMLVMKKYAVYDLHAGIQDYYQEQHMQRMEAEAAAARRAQEQIAVEQRAQTEIMEWQRRDIHWHNKEMEYQQQRQNETLKDIKQEQIEHNSRVERFLDDMEPPFIDF